MNDSYLGPNGFPEYQSVSWRQLVLCQEIGHDFGLAHQDEDFKNANLLSCMDYTDTPEGNEHPNQHDYDILDGINGIYAHLDVVEDGEEKGPPPGRGKKRRSEPPPAMGQIDFETPAQWGQLVSSTANGRGQVFELDFGGGHAVLTRVLWADPDVVGR